MNNRMKQMDEEAQKLNLSIGLQKPEAIPKPGLIKNATFLSKLSFSEAANIASVMQRNFEYAAKSLEELGDNQDGQFMISYGDATYGWFTAKVDFKVTLVKLPRFTLDLTSIPLIRKKYTSDQLGPIGEMIFKQVLYETEYFYNSEDSGKDSDYPDVRINPFTNRTKTQTLVNSAAVLTSRYVNWANSLMAQLARNKPKHLLERITGRSYSKSAYSNAAKRLYGKVNE